MTRVLKNNAKIIYIIYGVLCFLWLVLACIFMTPYKDTLVNFTAENLKDPSAVDYSNSRLIQFCNETGLDYPTYFKTMFQFNRQLQTVNQLMLYLGVISLIALAVMLICSNISRKRYYISNLVSGVAAPAVSGIFAIVVAVLDFGCIAPLSKDFAILNWGSLANDDLRPIKDVIGWYTANANDTSHFVLNSTSLILFGVFLIVFAIASMAMIAYNVFRYLDTRKELAQEKAVAE